MPCIYPLTAWRMRGKTKNGKQAITFEKRLGFSHSKMNLPCGQCVGCRLERTRQWAIRCMHEKQMHKKNSYITLTYREEELPENQSVCIEDFQKFMKRLRKKMRKKGIKFLHCGEYREPKVNPETGEIMFGPHYHALLFGCDFKDKKLFKIETGRNHERYPLYISETLSKLWPKGFHTIGNVTFDSAAYVASYVLKKFTNKDKEKVKLHYGERKPEYITMSRGERIGKKWYKRFSIDVYPSDEIIVKGFKMKPPKFYDKLFAGSHPEEMEKIKLKRIPPGGNWDANHGVYNPINSIPKLDSRRQCIEAKLKLKTRRLEND